MSHLVDWALIIADVGLVIFVFRTLCNALVVVKPSVVWTAGDTNRFIKFITLDTSRARVLINTCVAWRNTSAAYESCVIGIRGIWAYRITLIFIDICVCAIQAIRLVKTF